MADFFLRTPRIIQASEPDSWLGTVPKRQPVKHRRKRRSQQRAPFHLFKLIREANNLILSWRDGLTESQREARRKAEEQMQILAARMQNATTFEEWQAAAEQLDQLEGNDKWKLDDQSGDYHPEVIRASLEELDNARTNCDIHAMMYLIRTSLSRDLGGMGSMDLYRHSYIGTKKLVERYVKSAIQTIESVVEKSAYSTQYGLEPKDLLEGMLYARQSFGRSALLLSGGATFGMSHIGVLKTLYEQKLLPRIISGASAGSIVCSVVCTRTDEELPGLVEAFPFGDLGVFQGDEDHIFDHIRRLLTEGSWANIDNLTRVMRVWLGDLTFQEAYNRTRRICNICVSSASLYDLPRLLNYITAPNVLIWSAVAASCSVPLVFQGTHLLVKDPATGAHLPWNPTPQRLIDGSVDNDLPMTRLAEMFNVNHFIVSQVNPHVVPFLAKDDRLYPATTPGRLRQEKGSQDSGEWFYTLTALAKDEAMHRLHFLSELGIFPNLFSKLRCVLSQRYSGDITILPEIPLNDLPLILKNPTPEFMLRNCMIGERATWPKLSRIRDRLGIELALDQAVHHLRARVIFNQSQLDLRRLQDMSGSLGKTGYAEGGEIGRGQPPSSGDASPERRSYGRRRGSGSSIQLLAARHKNPFQGTEDGEEYLSGEDEQLELKFRPGSKASRRGNWPGITKPRLKRCSKSHGHMRAGLPSERYLKNEVDVPVFEITGPQASRMKSKDAGGEAVAETSVLSPAPVAEDKAESLPSGRAK
ncbi:patatin-domain-containing protein [Canariomyces notabilis]|uniref:Patatin-like phospholipase domain-containing protein n=1 Tax=Canariomyces notabilis TaxID=2074819 RepID=A0AAN6T7R8_9PEZI|nr:patatin-domain-containing protein [Canariomyces arenarius]